MPPNPHDLPLDKLREETIDRLIVNYGHGRLSQDALERRLDQALDAGDHAVLVALTEDLDPKIDPDYLEEKRTQERHTQAADDNRDVKYLVNVFSGGTRSGRWTVPGELRVITLFGGTELDLSNAHLPAGPVRIRLLCLFGGVDVFVPEQMNVTVEAFCVFGGIGDKSRGSNDPDAPRVTIDGLVMFGGAEVKIRKGLRQRLLELAEDTRNLFTPRPDRNPDP